MYRSPKTSFRSRGGSLRAGILIAALALAMGACVDPDGAEADGLHAGDDVVSVVNKGRTDSAVVVSPTTDCAAPSVVQAHGALLGAARATAGVGTMRGLALQPAGAGTLAIGQEGSFLCVQGQQVGYPVKSGGTYNLVDGLIIEYADAREGGGL